MTMQIHNNGNGLAHAPEGRSVDASIIERVIAVGDLSKLQPNERVAYYVSVCRSVGLNPLTKPFDYISLNGKLVLYSTKNCTDQLRQIHGVSVDGLKRETLPEGVHVVTANVSAKDGRRDEDIGAVTIKGLQGESLSNALMKATTKAKRRATLSICGLSFVDESEIESIPGARPVIVTADGEIVDPPKLLGPLPAAPVSSPDATVFAALCERVDSAETVPALNSVASAAGKAMKAGKITEGQFKSLGSAVVRKRELVAKPMPPPDDGPSYDSETDEVVS